MEFIYSKVIEEPYSYKVEQQISGILRFEVEPSFNYAGTMIQIYKQTYMVWFKEAPFVDLTISHGPMDYLISDERLCGIFVRNYLTIE
ncbi:hypothetical protein SAMN05518848_107147 [Paenibacillus sp. PDC88]|nr:hypothetical protein SAMN05518848_107147 [Paenibacillus sp. PDC88]